ncbi:unnamed protein product [Rotaria sp. Silwood2]|nr:unnamed protein product [Rotaria sp. Silwood2]CAF2983803.1 unnamed protein product [Rotaria sp. Silwood2]CAF3387310.1 unnamed protein product [Rotaria sp. Silwood2]CAF4162813.1 unnamed protein product [Rotaria sp. Silwood2]CAF4282061.1 unnamed protein product [Rotaria sp. Silwood2]
MIFVAVVSFLLCIIIYQCYSSNLDAECRSEFHNMLLENDGSGGGCLTKCYNKETSCEAKISAARQIQLIGKFHTYRSLLQFNQTITIGGHMTISGLETYYRRECDLKGFKKCEKTEWLNDKRWCFNITQEDQLLKLSQSVLKTQPSMKRVSPIVDENWKLLPFPNLFNVTILSVKSLESCNKTRQPIACHMMLENDCLFYMCHTNNETKLIQLTIKYEQLTVDLIMMCHLESITHYMLGDRIYRMLKQNGGQDTICHFANPQTNFFLCE